MSLRAFAKGFSTTAAPSFLRGFEQESGRLETRRQEGRQDRIIKEGYEREDKIRTEGFERADRDTAIADAKATLLGAANTGDSEAVTKAFGGMPPEMQDALRLSLGRYKYTATRKKQQLADEKEVRTADLAAKGGALRASDARTAKDKFTLEQGEATASGRKQWETLSIKDDDGYAATIVGFRELTENGYTPANIAQARRIAKALDKYSGSNEYYNRVEQGKRRDDQVNIEKGIMKDLKNYSPDMIWGIASRMEPGPEKDRLMSLAGGMGKELIESGVDRVYSAAYEYSISMGVGSEAAQKSAEKAAQDYRRGATKQARDRRLIDIAKEAAKRLSGTERPDIRQIMKVVRAAIQEDPDLFPTKGKIEELKQMIAERLGLDPGGLYGGITNDPNGSQTLPDDWKETDTGTGGGQSAPEPTVEGGTSGNLKIGEGRYGLSGMVPPEAIGKWATDKFGTTKNPGRMGGAGAQPVDATQGG